MPFRMTMRLDDDGEIRLQVDGKPSVVVADGSHLIIEKMNAPDAAAAPPAPSTGRKCWIKSIIHADPGPPGVPSGPGVAEWRRGYFHGWFQEGEENGDARVVAVVEDLSGKCGVVPPHWVHFGEEKPGTPK